MVPLNLEESDSNPPQSSWFLGLGFGVEGVGLRVEGLGFGV